MALVRLWHSPGAGERPACAALWDPLLYDGHKPYVHICHSSRIAASCTSSHLRAWGSPPLLLPLAKAVPAPAFGPLPALGQLMCWKVFGADRHKKAVDCMSSSDIVYTYPACMDHGCRLHVSLPILGQRIWCIRHAASSANCLSASQLCLRSGRRSATSYAGCTAASQKCARIFSIRCLAPASVTASSSQQT